MKPIELTPSEVVRLLGGPSEVARECDGITPSAVSQWISNDNIPKGWLNFLKERYPEVFGIKPRRRAKCLPCICPHCHKKIRSDVFGIKSARRSRSA